MTDYRQMWTDLGLNLEPHDTLLDVLGGVYKSTFMTQQNRPAAMGYFDFVISEVHGLRIKELQDTRAAGRKVIGTFCVFVPEELILAADAICVGLCAGAEFGFEEAEKVLPPNTCSLIKSFFGFKMSGVCPYIEASDMVVGETTCDGKKKAYEIFRELQPNLYVMELPQMKSSQDKQLLKSEYVRFKEELEQLTGVTIDAQRLKKGIEVVNNKRKALYRLATLRAADPSPISGLDALLVNQIAFYDDPVRFTESVNNLCDELQRRIENSESAFPKGTPRLLLSGCPMAIPNWKLPSIIETSDAVIVGEESCVGERGQRNLTADSANDLDSLIDAIVDRYFQIDCAVFTPNTDRLDHIENMAKAYKADGVIHYALQFCSPYMIEAHSVDNRLTKVNIPLLKIETDYGQGDVGQLKTRIQAFLEMIK